MSRFKISFGLIVGVAALSFAGSGCNPASLSYFLFKGDGKAPALYPLKPKEGKKDVIVAVLVTGPINTIEFAGLERELATAIGRSLFEQTKDSKKVVIHMIEHSRLDRFRAENASWRTMRSADIGKQLGADFAIDATVTSISLYDREIGGTFMYQGRASLDVKVYDTVSGSQHSEYYVATQMEQKPSEELPKSQYKGQLIQRIARDLAWKHVPHITDQRVSSANP